MENGLLLQALANAFLSEQSAWPTTEFRYVAYAEFLTPFELQALGNYIRAHERDLAPSHVLKGDEPVVDESRKSSVFEPSPAVKRMFIPRLKSVLPKVLAELEMAPFPVHHIQLQVTVSGDGDYFAAHRDLGHELTNNRTLTFVYYAHREPASFTGGALRFHLPCGSFHDVIPRQNTVLFFDPHLEHEVLPVSCVQPSLMNSRITVNGWLCTREPLQTRGDRSQQKIFAIRA